MGAKTGPKPKSVADRIWEGIDIAPSGCWLWPGATVTGGYAQMWVGSRTDGTRRRALAHVVSYETFCGDVPDDLQLDHLCRVPSCINPDHLEPVTALENMRRAKPYRRTA